MKSKEYYMQMYKQKLDEYKEIGQVVSAKYPLVYIEGLPSLKVHELVYFSSGDLGITMSIGDDNSEILLFGGNSVSLSSRVSRSNAVFSVRVGDYLLGKSIDPFCEGIHGDFISSPDSTEVQVDVGSSGISRREKITEPLMTGVTVVDLLIPQGRGQRSLILGDRKTGKTSFLMQTLLTQARNGTKCIYASIGKKKYDIYKVEKYLDKHNIKENVVVMSGLASDSPGMLYIMPYAAMSLAEYFRDRGENVLLILDDLTYHAKIYREISLMGKRFPGRDSYPGDVFYLHSRLLERAGNFSTQNGPKSITCLSVVDTTESDISGYIPTNLMSITDGHIYFDREFFLSGRRPAINYFLSVTRVGRQTQSALRWGINRELNSFLSLYEKTQNFVHFGAELNEGIKATLLTGKKLLGFFDQPMGKVLDMNIQMVIFGLIWTGIISMEDENKFKFLIEKAIDYYDKSPEFREVVENVISKSDTFNNFLKLCRENSSKFMSYLGTESYISKIDFGEKR